MKEKKAKFTKSRSRPHAAQRPVRRRESRQGGTGHSKASYPRQMEGLFLLQSSMWTVTAAQHAFTGKATGSEAGRYHHVG